MEPVRKKEVAIILVVLAVSAAAIIAFNFEKISPPHVAVQFYEPTLPASDERVVCIAFDDGWKSHLEVAQILESYNFNATFPIVTSYIGYPAYLNWGDIAALAAQGNDIVSHTQTHSNLSAVDEATLQAELKASRQVLRSS